MKLGVLAAGVAGAALIAGGPTAVWIASHNTYGVGKDDNEERVRIVQRHSDRDHRVPPGLRERLPLPPGLEKRLPEDMRKRFEDMRAYAEWARCVVTQAQEAEGEFDPTEECGPKPEKPELPGMRLPEVPDSKNP